jgi:hypothetical protein
MNTQTNRIIEKSRIIYKGDYLAGIFYIFIGVIMLAFGWGLSFWTKYGIGFHILSTGFFMLTVYGIVKGVSMVFIALKRYRYFVAKENLTNLELVQEQEYTAYRITKKAANRRRYIYITVIASLVAFFGIFTSNKGFYTGTAIPIALISGIEFTIGLLTEFRLGEYYRQICK